MNVQTFLDELLAGIRGGTLLEENVIINGLLGDKTPAYLQEESRDLANHVGKKDSARGILLCIRIAKRVTEFPLVPKEMDWLSSFATAWVLLEQILPDVDPPTVH